MAKFYTVEEFEALVAERVKAPKPVKHPPVTAERRRALTKLDSLKRQQIVRTSVAAKRAQGWRRPGRLAVVA